MSEDAIRCQFFRRMGDGSFIARGGEIGVASASGGWYLNRIGYGKLTAPAELVRAQNVEPGDYVAVWATGESATAPRRIAQFIIDSYQYRGGDIDLSGPNYLAALGEFVALDPIGERVIVSSLTEGFRPHPDNDLMDYAAYGPRLYQNSGGAPPDAGDTRFNTHTPVIARVGDIITIDFSTDTVVRPLFVSEVTHVTDGRTALEIADGLPYEFPPLAQFWLYSRSINVADASIFTVGEEVKFSTVDDGYNPLIIGRIADTQVVANNSDYITLENYFPITVPIGWYAVGVAYSNPTLRDVEQLLDQATDDTWRVNRAPTGYIPQTYDPNGESVFQALQAISEVSGWGFRLTMNEDAAWLPRNKIDYFPLGMSYPTASGSQLFTLGTGNRTEAGYGEIFELEMERTPATANYLVPFGGGSGETRFGIQDADIFGILAEYVDAFGQPRFAWGSNGRQHYVFYRYVTQRNAVKKWRVETFSHIYPENDASPTDRRNAADALLRAACEWLLKNGAGDATYKVTCHTVADPRPGDVIQILNYAGVDTFDIVTGGLIITEVHHEVGDPSGIRITKLTLSTTNADRMTGEEATARALRELQRRAQGSNIVSRGSARVDYDGATFRGATTVQATTGTLTMSTEDDDVVIASGAGVTIGGAGLSVTTTATVTGAVVAGEGVDLPGDDGNFRNVRIINVRGMPRLVSVG